MLRILGSPKKFCSGWTRRDMLQAGALGFFGLGLSDFFRLADLQAAPLGRAREKHFGRAKACILLHLYGSPSQLETVDMKPHAPVEIRGELKPIRSSLPGLDVCELLPNLAKVMDRTTVLRSMTHPYPIHGVAFALTGVPTIDVAMELSPRDPRHWPFVGSVIDYLDSTTLSEAKGLNVGILRSAQNDRRSARNSTLPRNIVLPFPFSSQRVGEVPRAGPYAAFLGGQYDPVF